MKIALIAILLSFVISPINLYAAAQAPAAQVVVPIDLNKAEAKALIKSVKGIGKKRAEAIVAYRKAKGPFKAIEELAKVKGLGLSFVKKNIVELKKVFKLA